MSDTDRIKDLEAEVKQLQGRLERTEQERDQWELKYKDAQERLRKSQEELAALEAEMNNQ
ncbi:hypothetical protein [Streptomyces sp. NPDC090093]|uniref:hypothetical protein n=1 Tax=Streptomyces sp. NPDC090093 TaxID=3365945 RepID=UPI003817FD80